MIAVYFLLTERLLPSLRSEPVRVPQGGALTESFSFRPLGVKTARPKDLQHVPDALPTLLLVFDSDCPACYENAAAWRAAINAAGEKIRVLALTFENESLAAGAYVRQQLPGAIPMAPTEPREFALTFGVEIVPFTALVDVDGTLKFVRPGRLDSTAVARLKRALDDSGSHLNLFEEE